MYSYGGEYLLPEREQFRPPTSMQPVRTNKTSDDNSPDMSIDDPRLNKYRDQIDELRGAGAGGRTFFERADFLSSTLDASAHAPCHTLCAFTCRPLRIDD